MMTALVLLLVGISLSAFFSGTETGFYRVTRVRLVLDTLDGDLISRCLLWFTNNPTLFVATVLIGVLGLGWQYAVVLLAAAGIVLAFAFFIVVRDTPEKHPHVNRAELALIGLGNTENGPQEKIGFKQLITNASPAALRSILLLAVAASFSSVAEGWK